MRTRKALGLGLMLLSMLLAISQASFAGSSEQSAIFAGEVQAAPSFHVVNLPISEVGGEGISWARVDQTPESFGRALTLYAGDTVEAVAGSTGFDKWPGGTQGPFNWPIESGIHYRTAGAWTAYPGDVTESEGEASYGGKEPFMAKFPLGGSQTTALGGMTAFAFKGRSAATEGFGTVTMGDYSSPHPSFPLKMAYGRSFARTWKEAGKVTSHGWAQVRGFELGDVKIDEIRGESIASASPQGWGGEWRLTVFGVQVGADRWGWTEKGVSFAEGMEGQLAQFNDAINQASNDEFRYEFKLTPGRVYRDDFGIARAQSGFAGITYSPTVGKYIPATDLTTPNIVLGPGGKGEKFSWAMGWAGGSAHYAEGDPSSRSEEQVDVDLPPMSDVTDFDTGTGGGEDLIVESAAPTSQPTETSRPNSKPALSFEPTRPGGPDDGLFLGEDVAKGISGGMQGLALVGLLGAGFSLIQLRRFLRI